MYRNLRQSPDIRPVPCALRFLMTLRYVTCPPFTYDLSPVHLPGTYGPWVGLLACQAEGSRRQTGAPMKDSEKMVQIREPGLSRNIGDREPGCLQELLRVVDSDTQYFVQHGAPELPTKRAFQRSPRQSRAGDDIVHRQIAPGKVSLDVSESGTHLRIFHRKNLGAVASDDSLW
jgi:hypothetical protein